MRISVWIYYIGIPRLDRYERAVRHELDPPVRVLELINLYPNDRQVTHRYVKTFFFSNLNLKFGFFSIWRDYTL